MNIQDLLDKSVIHGTMRSEDLIPTFFDLHAQLDPEGGYKPFKECSLAELSEDAKFWDSESAMETLISVIDSLDGLAPEGYYFGTHPGDGSDYGFWKCDDCGEAE